MIDWVIAALGAAIMFGIINNLDSHLISRRVPDFRVFLLLASAFILVVIIPVMLLFPLPGELEASILASAVASAVLRSSAVILMLFAFRSEEVVGVVPLVYTYPVFVAVTAVPLLGETLNLWQWLAIFIVVAGAILVALRPRIDGVGQWLGKNFPRLVLAALLFAGADLSGKYALEEISSVNLFWMSMLSLVVMSLVFCLRRSVLRNFKHIKKPISTLAILSFNEALVVCASLTTFYAMQNGPISLVSTVIATRPVFVFIIAIVLSRLFPGFVYWQSSRKALKYRFIATLLIITGIAIIYLA